MTAFDHYLADVSKIPLLSHEQETAYARAYQKGDESARDELVKANLRFVITTAKKFQNRGLDLPDLVAAGNAGLMRATKKFNPDRGIKFISYAVWWVRQAVITELEELGTGAEVTKVPQGAKQQYNAVYKRAQELAEEKHTYIESQYELALRELEQKGIVNRSTVTNVATIKNSIALETPIDLNRINVTFVPLEWYLVSYSLM